MSTLVAPLGTGPLPAAALPVMAERHAGQLLAVMLAPNGIPVDWWGDQDQVIAFTHDRQLALLAANTLAQLELRSPYACVARPGGIDVSGPHTVVLLGEPGTEFVDWRPTRPGDPYALYACVVRPARLALAEVTS